MGAAINSGLQKMNDAKLDVNPKKEQPCVTLNKKAKGVELQILGN